ncbi:uncharacterized protein LOC127286669 isoform X1 [Leptopilina boulardi]|uniref:uncharacterized protein LOC127286669 isoform X1 n=1 Tax=Leptopilina boulardi TaxID=63433 RepID=UPI0021F564BC|nr:uncharacterized protein LOC127286669 isoform X1 [Leptopilina boulardi]
MERNPYFHRGNYDASEQTLRNRIYGNEQTKMNQSINKRKSIEESAFYENKRRRDNIWTASRSSSNQRNTVAQYQETNWKFKEKSSSNTVEKFNDTCKFYQHQHSYPYRFMSHMYQIELSILCLLRKNSFTKSTEPAIFKNSKVGQFNNIIQCFDGEYYCIRVQYVDTHFITKTLNCNSLISKIGDFALTNYLNEFAMELICYLDQLTDAPKYLIIYTNCAFDLTHDKKLKQIGTQECNLLQLSIINSESDPDLIELLKSNGEFYRFANDEETRKNLFYLVNFSNVVQNKIKIAGLQQNEIKKTFFNRLVFAVNQPKIEELVEIVRNEIRDKNVNFNVIRKEIMDQLIEEEERRVGEKRQNLINTFYTYELFISSLHEMYLYENILGVRFDEKNGTHNIAMNSRNNYLYFKPLELIISEHEDFTKQAQFFFINTLFSFFILELSRDIDYFVIFTNGSLTLVKELILGKKFEAKDEEEIIHLLKFCRLNALEEKYFTFRHSFLNSNNLYQFSRGDTRKIIFDLLTIPEEYEMRNEKFSNDNLKEMFLDKIVFAVRQYNSEEFSKVLEKEIDEKQIPYDFINLNKIALRYLKSHENVPMTKEYLMTNFHQLRNNRQNIENRLFQEEIEFAKLVISQTDTPEFGRFVDFLTKGKGKICLDTLRRNGIELSAMSQILAKAGVKDGEKSFYELYNLWFDNEGNKTKLLKIFEGHGLYVKNISTMLKGYGSRSAKILINLYNLWFDNFGNPTNYLRTLQMEGVNLSHVSILLSGIRVNSVVERFKGLYSFWFNENGNKTISLKNLEKNGINLTIIVNLLHNSGESFPDLYKLWFDKTGRKTIYLQNLEDAGISLNQLCTVIKGSEGDAVSAFRILYNLWFEAQGRKTFYLKKLENENINLSIIFDILPECGCHVGEIFGNLFNHWFHGNGEKTHYLKILESKGRNLSEICRLLNGERFKAVDKFKTLVSSLNSVNSPLEQLINQMACKQEKMEIISEQFENVDHQRFPRNFEYRETKKLNTQEQFQNQKLFEYQNKRGENSKNFPTRGEMANNSQERFEGKNFQYSNSKGENSNSQRFGIPDENFQSDSITELNIPQRFEIPDENFQFDSIAELNIPQRFEISDKNFHSRRETQNSQKFEIPSENFHAKETNISQRFDIPGHSRRETENPQRFEISDENFQCDSITEFNIPQRFDIPVENYNSRTESNLPQKYEIPRETNFTRERNIPQERFQNSNKNFQNPLTIRGETSKSSFSEINSKFSNFDYKIEDDYASDENASFGSNENENEDFYNYDKEEQEEDDEEEYNDVDDHEFEEKPTKGNTNKLCSNTQLKRKIAALFKLFPAWKKVIRFRAKWKRVIREILPIINNPQALNSFLQTKLQKKRITQNEFNDIYSLRNHPPFAVKQLEHLLKGGKKAIPRDIRNEVKFAKLIFDEFNSEFNLLVNYLQQWQGMRYLSFLRKNKILPQYVGRVLRGCKNANEVKQALKEMCGYWFDDKGYEKNCLKILTKTNVKIRLLLFIIGGSGTHGMEAFDKLFNLLFDARGQTTYYLKTFERNDINLVQLCTVLEDSGANAAEIYHEFYDLCFDSNGRKTKYLTKFEEEGIKLSMLVTIFKTSGAKICQVFRELYNYLFDSRGNKTVRLQNLEKNGIHLTFVANVLNRKGPKAPEAFDDLYKFVFNENGYHQEHIRILERELNMREIFEIICGYETDLKCFKELYDLWYDERGMKSIYLRILDENGVNLKCLASVLKGTGLYAYVIFNNLFSFFFDDQFRKKDQLKNIEQVIELRAMLEIVIGSKKNVFNDLRSLYNLWFDAKNRKTRHILALEENDINLMEISGILYGTGGKAVRKFKKILDFSVRRNYSKYELLEHFQRQNEDEDDDEDY